MVIKVKTSMQPTANILFRVVGKIRKYLKKKITNPYYIPVIINNFNRLEWLVKQINWLEKAGMKNIYIIDNDSTYPPLLSYYAKTKHIVLKLSENFGHESLWKTHLQLWFCFDYYVYTDPDIIPVDDCPFNTIEYFFELLQKYPTIKKVGFGLKIDDLPDYYVHKQKVIQWEEQFWKKQISEGLFEADIDTTFALYKPNTNNQCWGETLRTSFPYIARHMPWYNNSTIDSEEEDFYKKHASSISSWIKNSNQYT